MEQKKFKKTKENFICENCQTEVIGNGFTNHCTNCFYSKHVDINPGDRACKCKGLMEPIGIDQKNGEFFILHKCIRCNFEKKNKINANDNRDNLYKLIKKLNLYVKI